MQKLIIVAAVLASALAAPVENIKETFQITDLSRPSPINPDIPSDPKPEDKVTLIADPKQVPLVESKATPKLLGPYVLPSEALLRSKRADKGSSESDEDSSSSEEGSNEKKRKPSPQLKARPLAVPSADLQKETAAKTAPTPTPSATESSSSDASTSIAPVLSKIPYSPQIHQHNAHLIKPATESNTGDSIPTSTATTTTSAPSVVPSKEDHTNDKHHADNKIRLLTRKQPHNDDDETKKKNAQPDAAKVPKEEVKQEDKKDEDQKAEPTPHPATIQHPIPVAELFAKKPSE